jgi:large subunit ribosomal protein L13
MCALIASRLRGKNKVNFTPNKNCGDHVVVINAKQVALTGKKESKRFYWHTGYVGGIKFRTIHQLRAEKPEKIIINSVRRMITRSPLGRAVLKNLHVYAGNAHPHMGQQPKILDLASTNRKNVKRK